jgi:hypothetical protein
MTCREFARDLRLRPGRRHLRLHPGEELSRRKDLPRDLRLPAGGGGNGVNIPLTHRVFARDLRLRPQGGGLPPILPPPPPPDSYVFCASSIFAWSTPCFAQAKSANPNASLHAETSN